MANKRTDKGVIAIYQYLDTFCEAIEKVRSREDFAGHECFSPTSYHEVEHASGFGPSPVRVFTLVGGLTGMMLGFGLCLITDWDWPLIVGGKAPGIASLPAYVVIGFECTILLGAIATIAGMLILGRIPNPKRKVLDPRITDDRFAIFVPNVGTDSNQAQLLKDTGAEEVRAT